MREGQRHGLDPEVRRRLRWVRIGPGAVPMARFPDFLLIGPHRTGTSWMYHNLREHPEVLLSEPKELYFFDRLQKPEDARYRSSELQYYLRFFRNTPARWLRRAGRHAVRYRELYRPRIRGEATASYAVIDPEVIREITLLNPGLRAVVLIRNPIDRAWSHAKKDLAKKRQRRTSEIPEREIEAFLSDPYQQRLADYASIIDNWSRHLAPGHLFVGSFDDIVTRPEGLLADLLGFLGVSRDRRFLSRVIRSPVNRTETASVPERYRRLLEERLAAEMERTRQRFRVSW